MPNDYIKELQQAEVQIVEKAGAHVPNKYKKLFDYHWDYFWNAIKKEPVGELTFIEFTYGGIKNNKFKVPSSMTNHDGKIVELLFSQYLEEAMQSEKNDHLEWFYSNCLYAPDFTPIVDIKFINYLTTYIYYKTSIRTTLKQEKSNPWLAPARILSIRLDFN